MNDPIISPWLVYLIGRMEILKFVFFAICAIAASAVSCSVLSGEAIKKKQACIFVISFLVFCAIPEKQELLEMYTVSKVTPANIQAVGESADKAADKVVEKIIRIIEAAKKEGEKND